ncbi:MAG TPA: DMT family transporter [Symbiobacteriaceae bacterium]
MKLSLSASGAILTAISALGFSTLPIFGVLAYRAGANVPTLLGVRFLMAAAALWAYVLITRRTLPDLRTALQLLLMGGVGYTAMSSLYLSSVAADRLSPSLAALLLYTYPAIVACLAWWFDGQTLTGRKTAALLVTLAGVALVLIAPGAGSLFTWTGALLALASSVVYAIYIFFGSRVSRRSSPVVVTAYVSTATAAVFLGYGVLAGDLVRVAPAGWWAMAGTAFFATVLAVMLFFAGVERLGPSRASIVSTLEPVGTALLSAVAFGDRLGPWQVGGGALVLAGIVWLQLRRD